MFLLSRTIVILPNQEEQRSWGRKSPWSSSPRQDIDWSPTERHGDLKWKAELGKHETLFVYLDNGQWPSQIWKKKNTISGLPMKFILTQYDIYESKPTWQLRVFLFGYLPDAETCKGIQPSALQTISRQKSLNGSCHKFYLGITRMMLINSKIIWGISYKCWKSLIKYFEVTRQK